MADRGRKVHFAGFRGNKSTRGMRGRYGENSGTKHPPGLKGKQIGLWYAKRQKKKTQESTPRSLVDVSREQKEKLTKLLSTIRNLPLESGIKDLVACTSSFASGSTITEYTEDLTDISKNLTLGYEAEYEPSANETFESRYSRHRAESKLRNDGKIEKYDESADNEMRNTSLDTKLTNELTIRQENNKSYIKMQEFRQKLPAHASRDTIVGTIEENQVVVISGETGCGKTTQVPQFILDSYIQQGKGSVCKVVCTQPRRISAISVAERVAQERGESCGNDSVGYQIRLEHKLPREQGSILFCTTGIVLKWLESDAWLSRATHIIIDEVHERDVLTDFLMIIVKRILKQRPNLKVIIMSASLNAEKFSAYFDGCPMLNIPGFTFPVEDLYLEDVLAMTGHIRIPSQTKFRGKNRKHALSEYETQLGVFLRNLPPEKYSENVVEYLQRVDESEIDVDLIVRLIHHLCLNKPAGAILVFLPGWDTISKVNGMLQKMTFFQSRKHLIIPLHSLMPTINQREIFDRPPPGVRKIILATNIAETSITIDDVVYVVDSGKIKLKRFDMQHEVATLRPEWVSKANALQRRGRAGRVQPGICYHLFTRYRREFLMDYQLPEILRTRLEELCLQIKLLKLGSVMPFLDEAMESPSKDAVKLSLEFLRNLHALDAEEILTPLGFHLAQLPVDPQAGKMILFGAIFGCLDPITTIAASLSFKDAFLIPLGKEAQADAQRKILAGDSKSDHLMLVNAFVGWEKAKHRGYDHAYCWDHFLSNRTLQLLSNMKEQFLMVLRQFGFVDVQKVKHPSVNQNAHNEKLILAIVCAGLYPNVGYIKNPKRKINPRATRSAKPVSVWTKQDKNACLHRKSVNESESTFESPLLVYYQRLESTKVYLHDTSMISPIPLLLFGDKIQTSLIDSQDGIIIDDWIKILCSCDDAELILFLRRELDNLLQYKILHPKPTNWDVNCKEGAILRGVIDLISSEKCVMTIPKRVESNDEILTDCEDDDDDDE